MIDCSITKNYLSEKNRITQNKNFIPNMKTAIEESTKANMQKIMNLNLKYLKIE